MKKTTHIISDLICVEKIFAESKHARDLATQLAGFADMILSTVKLAVPGLAYRVKDGPQDAAVSLFLEITVDEEKK